MPRVGDDQLGEAGGGWGFVGFGTTSGLVGWLVGDARAVVASTVGYVKSTELLRVGSWWW